MMPRFRDRTWAALLAAVVAVLITLRVFVAMLFLDPLPSVPGGATDETSAAATTGTAGAAARGIPVAMQSDPFHPARHAPTVAFRLPGEAAVGRPVAAPTRTVRVIGVAVVEGGKSFVLAESEGELPKVVRIGERLSGYRLTAVDLGGATFVGPDGRSQRYLVAKAGS